MTRAISRQRGLAALRRITRNFIANDPTTVVLTPHTQTPTPGGGYAIVPGTSRQAQDFKMIPVPASLDGLVQGEGAASRTWSYVLLGDYDAQVEVGDTWQDGNTTYRVTALMQENDYEKRFVVVAFGMDPSYG